MLMRAMTRRKIAETPVPIVLPTALNQANFACSAPTERATSRDAMMTTVEWPSAKKNPAEIGRLPSCINFLVTLSMAAM